MDSKKTVKRNRDKEKEKDNNRKKEGDKEKENSGEKERGGEKDRNKEQDRKSLKKSQEGKAKEKVKGSEKDGERKKEKEREKDLEKKTERHKSQTSEKQSTSSEDKGKGIAKELTKKRPQQTKFNKSDRMSEKSSRSSSDSKTPTSPPTPAKKPLSTKTKNINSPMTPTTPPESDVVVAGDDTYTHSPHTTSKVAAGEKMDTQGPHSAATKLVSTANDVRRAGREETGGVPETPESPPAQPKGKKSGKVESDLSSGEEFPESATGSPLSPSGAAREEAKKEKVGAGGDKEEKSAKPTDAAEPVKFRMKISGSSSRVRHGSGVASPPTAQWSPDPPSSHRSTPSQSHGSPPPPRSQHSPHRPPSTGASHRSPPPPRLSGEESEEGSRKSRKLPRCYQLEEERLREKQRGMKEHSHPKPHPPPTTPSPPPAYASHRRRPVHSPPPPDHSSRWRRGRHYAHGHQFGPRPYSRSPPPGYPQSPPPPHSGGRSPYSGSPPPRPRTPIQRPRDRGGPRHRYDSPPYDMPHGKHGRRGSSPMRHNMSPSPPLPRRRSPVPGHRYPRRYSRSPSPQRRSPLRRKERSLSPGSSRGSPRYSEDRLEVRKYGKKPPVPVYSRSPSPKPKRRDAPPREDYPDPKRRRIDDARMKSPTGGSSAQKDEQMKSSRGEKSQHSPYTSSGGPSDRHVTHHAAKESQLLSQTHGNPASHHTAVQGKASSAGASSAVASNTPTTKPSQQPQQPTDNLMDLLR